MGYTRERGLAQKYSSEKAILKELSSQISNDPPGLLKNIISRTFERQERIYLCDSFLYIYNQESKARIDECLTKTVKESSKWIDDRVLRLPRDLSYAALLKKLRSKNFLVQEESENLSYFRSRKQRETDYDWDY